MRGSWTVWLLCALALSIVLHSIGCGTAGSTPPLDDSPLDPKKPPATSTCQPGLARACHQEISRNAGNVMCFAGQQTCTADGIWGKCVAGGPDGGPGEVYAKRLASLPPVPEAPKGSKGLAPVGPCSDPCDPGCQVFAEVPDGGISPEASVYIPPGATVVYSGGTIYSIKPGEIPPGFVNKGNDPNGVCDTCAYSSSDPTCQSACHFDTRCNGVEGLCEPNAIDFTPTCAGVDITVPPACITSTGGTKYAMVAACNRGNATANAGIRCWVWKGGAANPGPEFLAAAPDMTGAVLVMTTTVALAPGECESQPVPETLFPSGGNEEIMCNVPETRLVAYSSTMYATVVDSAGLWKNPGNVAASDGANATLDMGTYNSSRYASSYLAPSGLWSSHVFASVEGDGQAMYTDMRASQPSGWVLPTTATVKSGTWSSPSSILSKTDGASTTATSLSPGVVATSTASSYSTYVAYGTSCADNPSGYGCTDPTTITNFQGAPDSVYTAVTVKRDKYEYFYAHMDFSGGAAVPSTATLDSVTISTAWTTACSNCKLRLTIYNAAWETVAQSGNYSTSSATTTVWTIPKSSFLKTFTANDLTSQYWNVYLTVHGPTTGSSATSYTVSLDSIRMKVDYSLPLTANLSVGGFGTFGLGVSASYYIPTMSLHLVGRSGAATSTGNVQLNVYRTRWGTENQIGTCTVALASATNADYHCSVAPNYDLMVGELSTVRVEVLPSLPVSATSTWNSYFDYIEAKVLYGIPYGDSQQTTLTGFGFDSTNLPAEATITKAEIEYSWNSSVAVGANQLYAYANAYTGGSLAPPMVWTDTLGVSYSVYPNYWTATNLGGPFEYWPAGGTGYRKVAQNMWNPAGGAILPSQLWDANAFAVTVSAYLYDTHSSTNPRVSFDYVKVNVDYYYQGSSFRVSGFGFAIPADATITNFTLQARGGVTATSNGTTVGFSAISGGSSFFGTTSTSGVSPPLADQDMTASKGSGAGLSPSTFNSGALSVGVTGSRDSTTSGTTARLDYVRAIVDYTRNINIHQSECNPNNNWSVVKLNPGPECIGFSRTSYDTYSTTNALFSYTSTCASGYRPQWEYLTYNTGMVPTSTTDFAGAHTLFEIALTPYNIDGSLGSPIVWTTGAVTSTWLTVADAWADGTVDPMICDSTVPCTRNLFSAIGGLPNAQAESLTLRITMSPATDEKAAPIVNTWNIAYSCVAAE